MRLLTKQFSNKFMFGSFTDETQIIPAYLQMKMWMKQFDENYNLLNFIRNIQVKRVQEWKD